MPIKSLCLFLFLSACSFAQNYRFTTIAGYGTFGGDGGLATDALVNPAAVAVAPDGTLYVADPDNFRIRKIDRLGKISTLTGTGVGGFSGDGGQAAAAQNSGSYNLALDANNNLYFTDDGNSRIREVTAAGVIKTIAGTGICGTPTAGMSAVQAPLCDVEGVAVDAQGRVFFGSSSQVWMMAADGTLVLIAGKGSYGNSGDGGLATAAELSYLSSIAIDRDGIIYLGDFFNLAIRKVTLDKKISLVIKFPGDGTVQGVFLAPDNSGTLFYTIGGRQLFKMVAGTPVTVATLPLPQNAVCLVVDQTGAFYLCSNNTQRLFKGTTDGFTAIAGAYPYDVDQLPQPATNVRLHMNPLLIALAVDANNNVYFVELDGDLTERIDKVTPAGTMSQVPTPLLLAPKVPFTAQSVAISPTGAIYYSTFTQVYRVESDASVTLIAGAPSFPTLVGDGGPATLAQLHNPSSLAFDSAGNLYITEPFDSRVRKVGTNGIINTFAGTGVAGNSGDGGLAVLAKLSTPVDVKVDHDNVYIADVTASVVRKVTPNGSISTVAGKGTKGFSGDGGLATKAELSGAAAIAIDPAGNLFIADRPSAASTISPAADNHRIRMVNTSGIISTLAGPAPGYSGENVGASTAALGGPFALATDAQGNLYVAESGIQRIRKLSIAPAASSVVISSVATAYGNPEISQNGWMEIKGVNLAPASVGTGVDWSSAPDFAQGKMPTSLNGVSVKVNGKAAFIYFVSPGQINALSPLDNSTGSAQVVVTNGTAVSDPFSVTVKAATPSFLRIGATNYITSTHGDGSLLGPASISVPGYNFTPAKPSEIVVLYSVGFGLPNATLTNGASSQFGMLAPLPMVQVGGVNATVQFAGINGAPGLYQLNVVVPPGTPNGDAQVTLSYGGNTTPVTTIPVQK